MARAISLAAALVSLAAPLGSTEWGAAIAPAQGVDKSPGFGELWEEARHWAAKTNAEALDCVFSFGFDAKTKRLQSGYSVTCDEPYRSPFYPWPAASRAGARFTPDDIERYGRESGAESGKPARSPAREGDLPESCGVVIGFTKDGQGAEAIECYWMQGSVPGRRVNTAFLVETASGERVASRLNDRIAKLGKREMREILKRLSEPHGRSAPGGRKDGTKEVAVKITGKVVGRGANTVRVWGRALPLLGQSPTELGVVTADANIVVHYPSDDALRPVYYGGGEHCFKEKRQEANASGTNVTAWVYGPCALGPDEYWMFERYPPGRKTMAYGPYRDYEECDRDRQKVKVATLWVSGHCASKAGAAFQMMKDGTLVVPQGAPPIN